MPKTNRNKFPQCKHCGRTIVPITDGTRLSQDRFGAVGAWMHRKSGQIACKQAKARFRPVATPPDNFDS